MREYHWANSPLVNWRSICFRVKKFSLTLPVTHSDPLPSPLLLSVFSASVVVVVVGIRPSLLSSPFYSMRFTKIVKIQTFNKSTIFIILLLSSIYPKFFISWNKIRIWCDASSICYCSHHFLFISTVICASFSSISLPLPLFPFVKLAIGVSRNQMWFFAHSIWVCHVCVSACFEMWKESIFFVLCLKFKMGFCIFKMDEMSAILTRADFALPGVDVNEYTVRYNRCKYLLIFVFLGLL